MSDAAHILPPREGAPGGPGEEAARWLAYLYSGEATGDGRREFSDWLQRSEANARAYRNVQQTWRDMAVPGAEGFFREPVASDAADERVVVFEPRRRQRPAVAARRGMLAAAAIAATVVVGVGVWRTQVYDPVTAGSYATRTGEVRTVALPDGSKITLAAASSVRTAFSKKRRHVELVRGGAYFDVSRDPAKPFTVAAAASEIRVVGTEFDVNLAPRDVRIAVAEGVVRIGPAATGGAQSGLGGVRLRAGQRVTATLDGRLGPIEAFDPKQAAAWRQGRLVYRNARLEDVVAEVNRYRDDKIVIGDVRLVDVPITLATRTDQTDALLSGLEATSPVVIERSERRVVLRLKTGAGG